MTVTAEQYENSVEHISTPELIAGYLRRLKEAHTLLKVTIPGYNEICSTILVVINEGEKFLVLDKLHPEKGHQAFLGNKQCKVHAQHQGVDMGFTAQLDEIIGSAESPAYRIAFPTELLYHQKRSAYRAPISANQDIEVTLTAEDRTVFLGKLYNVSTGGLCINMQPKSAEKLKVGDLMPRCYFQAASGLAIESAVEVRNIKTDEDKKISRVGVRFMEITPQELRAIQRFVLALEREQIKRNR